LETAVQVKANGITFNCQVDGADVAPWLIFSNSLATDLTMWDEQARALSGSFRVLRYDQRGHGKTEAPEGDYTFATLIDDVIALMDALRIGRAHVCGLSMGGGTALGLVQQHPDRIDRTVVCDTPGVSTPAAAEQWQARMALARDKGMAALAEPTLQRWFPPEVYAANPPFVAKVRNMVLATPVNGFAGCAAALCDHDFSSGAGAVRKPLLFVCGEKDAPNAAMRDLHKRVAGSQFAEMPGAGHISNVEQPALFTRTVAAFLAS
jgi:3-oxoadipate enol-lactonase